MRQQQINTTTAVGRHTPLFRGLKTMLQRDEIVRPRILSFGCSRGFECADIHAEIPDADIFGCDVDAEALSEAEERCRGFADIFLSTKENIERQGKFDAVVALNVFCRFPQSAGCEDISTIYPFELFDIGIRDLASAVAPGGYLGLYNGAYFFEDTSVSKGFLPEENSVWPRNGWIEKCLPNGVCATNVVFEFQDQTFSLKEWLKWARDPINREAIFSAPADVRYKQTWRSDEPVITSRSLETVFWQRQP